jgi:riboflavin kinase/FMN adenylyltransferase
MSTPAFTCLDATIFLPEALKSQGGVYALGVFDGVHLGHQAVFSRTLEEARRLGTWAGVFSFSTHPKAYLKKTHAPYLLASVEEKMALCRGFGLDVLVMPPFNETFRRMSATAFITDFMKAQLGAVHVVVGYDFHFGFQRQGNADWLLENAERLGIGVSVVEALPPTHLAEESNTLAISSTWIRHLLGKGDVKEASLLLGRAYRVLGKTQAGRQLGRTLGFPTLNIQPTEAEKIIPKNGVYITHTITAGQVFKSVTNVGTAPTVNEGSSVKIESHVLEVFAYENWWQQPAEVVFHQRLRDEIRFENVEALTRQITQDVEKARAWHQAHPQQGLMPLDCRSIVEV